MTTSRKLSLVALLAVAGLLAGGWFLLVSPKKSEAADLRSQTSAAEDDNASLRSKLAMLKELAPSLPQREAEFAAIRRQIPDNPALPMLIRQLTAAADDAGAELVSLAPTTPTAVVAAAPVAATTGAAAPSDQLMQVQLALSLSGSYSTLEQFVSELEGLRRVFLVTGFSIAPSQGETTESGDLTLTVSGRVFMVNSSTTADVTPAAGVTPAPGAATTTSTTNGGAESAPPAGVDQ
jgi:Tfp pilus assembly protein PilO